MLSILDPGNLWVGPTPLLLQGNRKPIAGRDAVSVPKDAGPVTIAVLANDHDPEGGPLTLVFAAAALGTAVAEANGTVTYTPPPGVAGFDTIAYEIADAEGLRRGGQVDVTIVEPALTIAVEPGNTLTVNAETGTIEITVTEPATFAGTWTADLADLAGGPVTLVPPGIEGTLATGEVLTARGGLWIHDTGAGTPARSWQWRRGGTDIPGATAATRMVETGDTGPGLAVVETLSDGYGQRSAASPLLGGGAAFVPSDDPGLIGWWDASDPATLVQSGGLVSGWQNKVAGGVTLSAAGSRRPATGTRQLGGRNVLDFTGSELAATGLAVPAGGDIAFHMALVVDGITNTFEAVLAVEAARDFQIDAGAAARFDGRLNVTGIGSSFTCTGGPFAGPMILSAMFDRSGAAEARIFIGGVSRGSAAYTAPIDAGVALHVMTNRSKNAWTDGAVAELIVTRTLSNRAQHHGHLAAKWGLS